MARRKTYRLRYGHEVIWSVTTFTDRAGNPVARVYADIQHGISKVIFGNDASTTDKVNVLAACVEWANQASYLQKRPKELAYPEFGKQDELSRATRGYLSPLTEYGLLKYQAEDLVEFLTGSCTPAYGTSILELRYRNLRHAARCINTRNGIKGRAHVSIAQPYERWQEKAVVTIKVTDTNRHFEFWNDMRMPSRPDNDKWCFDVIPTYHPCRTPGREQVMMINGSTEALITGWASASIYPPESMRRLSEYNHINTSHHGSWSYVMHPVVAQGTSFSVELDAVLLLTRSGADLLVDIITAAFDDTKDYIGVSGGFSAPKGYPYPPGAHTSPPRATGAEDKMAWTYHVLEEEDTLKGAFVPRWFRQKGWLDFYEASRSVETTPLKPVS